MPDCLEILDDLVGGDHVGVFGIEVEQALIVGRLRSIADGFAHDDGPEPDLAGIDRCGADAAAGGASSDDQCIDIVGQQA